MPWHYLNLRPLTKQWSDERVFAYLNQLPPEGVNGDFHVLYHAFKHMRPSDYERLLTQFEADGHEISTQLIQKVSAFMTSLGLPTSGSTVF